MRQKNQAAVALGRLGGKARAKRPKALLSAIGKKGARARWRRKKAPAA
jgi:hypothetical protein